MDQIRNEGMPLNSSGGANIYLNMNNNSRHPAASAVIYPQPVKQEDVGLHINTTLSVKSSKILKVLFTLNILLTVACVVITFFAVPLFYRDELDNVKKHMSLMKDYLHIDISEKGVLEKDARIKVDTPDSLLPLKSIIREPRMEADINGEIPPNTKKLYVDNLGDNVLLLDSSKKNPASDKSLQLLEKELMVAHFDGAHSEINLGSGTIIGPWKPDPQVSSKNSQDVIQLDNDNKFFTVKKDGLYLIYAQLVYLTHEPNCYYVWARMPAEIPRLITTCATGDDSTLRPLSKSQISCAIQIVVRLKKGETVNMAQREYNRTVWLRTGYSYFGFVKLSS